MTILKKQKLTFYVQNSKWARSAPLLGFLFALALQPAAFASTSVCDAVSGNLIVNCGFETQPVAGNVPPGWTAAQFTGEESIVNGGDVVNSGNYALRISNDEYQGGPLFNGAAILSQTFTDTPGEVYDFNFYLLNGASNGGSGIQFQAFWDSTAGTPLLDLTDTNVPTAWTEYSYSVTGTGSDTITFTAYNDPNWFYLDDVEVVASGQTASPVPEPGSATLLGFGLAAMAIGFASRFRRRVPVR